MKVNFRNQEIDVEVIQEKATEEISPEYTCYFGLYRIDIYNDNDSSDVNVEISAENDDDFIEELFFSEDDSISDILQSAFNVISHDIDFKKRTIKEFQQVLDSVSAICVC